MNVRVLGGNTSEAIKATKASDADVASLARDIRCGAHFERRKAGDWR